MTLWLLIVSGYLALLFGLATLVQKQPTVFARYISPATVYTLSIAVYCTAWTFYGSVGNAARTGLGFLPVYLGPTFFMPLLTMIWLRMLRICKENGITNMADLIAARYGNSATLGILISVFYIIGVIPYISIQLKAIRVSLGVVSGIETGSTLFYQDILLYAALVIGIFAIIYGTRFADSSERHPGLVFTIAFESLVKIVAFILVGLIVCFLMFNGIGDIFNQFRATQELNTFLQLDDSVFSPLPWLLSMIVSALAMLMLPRQFQMVITENNDHRHLYRAVWLLPLYLFVINIFVLPIALAGKLILPPDSNPDAYVLLLPASKHMPILTGFVFLGGLSAAIGMIVVETIALSSMLTHSIVMPALVALGAYGSRTPLGNSVLWIRRTGILMIILCAYFFESALMRNDSLYSIGFISFTAVAQMAPALILGLYWPQATRTAAIVATLAGMAVWFYTLIAPILATSSSFFESVLLFGPARCAWLRPQQLFGLSDLDPLSHGIFWSLTINTLLLVGVSLFTRQSDQELMQTQIFTKAHTENRQLVREGTVSMERLYSLLNTFIDPTRSRALMARFARKLNLPLPERDAADPLFSAFAERILRGVVGSVAARMLVASAVNDERITYRDMVSIVHEKQQVELLNRVLKQKSAQLEKATAELTLANNRLTQLDELKDEFLYTVTHELRTPLTAIRAMSEILQDNPDLDEPTRRQYIDAVVSETIRMSHLINQVLTLERFESGRQRLILQAIELQPLLHEVRQSVDVLALEKNVVILLHHPDNVFTIRADRDMVFQVFYNLVTNAIKFARKQVNIHVFQQDNEVIVAVADDGPGIPVDQQKLIFDKFYQIKSRKLLKPEGAGLGLAICKKIVELHDYRIWVENRSEQGAKFFVAAEMI